MLENNDSKDELKKYKKEISFYKRKIRKLEKSLELCEKTRDRYNQFYLKCIDTLRDKQEILDQRNQELLQIKESLASQNEVLHGNQKQLQELNQQLNDISNLDALTGLRNRKCFDEVVQNMAMSTNSTRISLFLIDLDGFKAVNDCYGHDAGDALLQEIALRLKNVVRGNDKVFRLGGDEFTLLVTDVLNNSQLEAIGARIIRACEKSVIYEDQCLRVSSSIGVASYPDNYDSSSNLDVFSQIKKAADVAMYKVKNNGKNHFQFYSDSLVKEMNHFINESQSLKKSIEDEAFVPFFQSQHIYSHYSSKDKEGEIVSIVGLEALVRRSEKLEERPDKFLPVIQKLGLISDLDLIMLKKVCIFINENRHILDKIQHIAINYAAETFSSAYHMDQTFSIMEEFDISPNNIMIELTERTFLSKDKNTKKNLQALSRYGVLLALDDFGTGYSSLECLNRVKFDYLKIDRTFVKSLSEGKFSRIVIAHICSLSKELNVDVIAEGIENEEQLEYLRGIGINKFQGFLFDKPQDQVTLLGKIEKSIAAINHPFLASRYL